MMLSTDGDMILHLVVISVYLLSESHIRLRIRKIHSALSLSLSLSLSLILLHNSQSSETGPLYRNLKESLGPRGARNAVPSALLRAIRKFLAQERKGEANAKLCRFHNSTE